MQNPDSPLKLLRLPSLAGENYELVAVLPLEMTVEDGVALVDQIIREANQEDYVNNGVCDDGLSVEASIKNRLHAKGFVFPEVGVTKCWDDYCGYNPCGTREAESCLDWQASSGPKEK